MVLTKRLKRLPDNDSDDNYFSVHSESRVAAAVQIIVHITACKPAPFEDVKRITVDAST